MHRTCSEDRAAMALIRLIARNLVRRLYDNPNCWSGKQAGVAPDDGNDRASDGFGLRWMLVTRRFPRRGERVHYRAEPNAAVQRMEK